MRTAPEGLSISELNSLIKGKLETDPDLNGITIHGEISNFRLYPSGHAYFSLKDDRSVISAVMWASSVAFLRFSPKDGDEVVARGRISVYPPRGSYQFTIDRMNLSGEGAELLRLKQLAEKLAKEGLFDPSRKRKLPPFPLHIGVIAGKGSAGMKDIVYNATKRWPLATLHIFPSLVQGKEAPQALIQAFAKAQEDPLDVLIIGRGGGSSEDLSAFNDEQLVRTVATSKCPVISAVGHEIDTTLIDLVADLRVSTPTAAAVAATPDQYEVTESLDDASMRLSRAINGQISLLKGKVELLANRSFFTSPSAIYEEKAKRLQETSVRIRSEYLHMLAQKKALVVALSGKLEALNPYGVIQRGYSILENSEGKVVSSIEDVSLGDTIKTRLKDGIITATVLERSK